MRLSLEESLRTRLNGWERQLPLVSEDALNALDYIG
jgi:hypothetical protein